MANPLADRNLGRRQFQGDAAARLAHRPARRSLSSTCMAAATCFKGRVSGFTMGTGSTLALLPAQNATGNFIKVVQRLPVRIELGELRSRQESACSSAPRSFPTSTSTSRRPDPTPESFSRPTCRQRKLVELGRRTRGQTMTAVGTCAAGIRAGEKPVAGRRRSSWCRPSWRCSTRRSRWSRCAISPAACRRRSTTANGFITSYLAANAIILPITGWLARILAAATTSCCRSPSSRSARRCAAWRPVLAS